jgi:arabinose-5-phosphate isomerase
VAITADEGSPLALAARVVLPIGRPREAGPGNLVPTSSTTAMLALGDALAMALLRRRGFTAESLAFVHPAGVIGRQAGRTAESLMHSGAGLPRVPESATLREALLEIIQKKLGITTIVDTAGRLTGVLTDGDLKRILVRPAGVASLDRPVAEVMTHPPRVVAPDAPIAVAVREMENPALSPVTALVVISAAGEPLGVLHLHDCLKPV